MSVLDFPLDRAPLVLAATFPCQKSSQVATRATSAEGKVLDAQMRFI